jgi:hypothetical protein
MTNALRGRIPVSYLGQSCRWSCCHFLHMIGDYQLNDVLHMTQFS